MGIAKFRKIIVCSALLCSARVAAQPFVDLINTSYQSLSTVYKDTSALPNRTENYFLNLTIPVKLDSQYTFIARFYGEKLVTNYTLRYDNHIPVQGTSALYSALVPLGIQYETSNKKWKTLFLVMPKLSSDLQDPLDNNSLQLGGYGMATYSLSDKLKLKFGLFYNREAFGNFFVPLASLDWRPCDWFQTYGVLPNNYRIEFAPWRKRIHAGLAFKSYTRSYRLGSSYRLAYVRNNEIQAKLFVDVYLAKRYVMFVEFGRTLGYSPLAYSYRTKDPSPLAPQYNPIKDAYFFNVGVAYRIRFDF